MEELQTSLHSAHHVVWLLNTTHWRQGTATHQQTQLRTCMPIKMVAPPPRPALLLLVLMSMTLVTSGFPQPHLRPLQRNSPPVSQEDSKREQWEVLYPSISLRDWSIQMLSAPDFGAAKPKADEWLPLGQPQLEEELGQGWPGDWSARMGNEEKRNIVVADDAAFREKSKLFTAMERQKWLNSYMQKLLVVNSQ